MKKVAVKKFDMSAAVSNLAIFTAVVVVSLPLLLGDQLGIVVSNVAYEGSSLIQDLANSFVGLFS
jgi:hypothetical protein